MHLDENALYELGALLSLGVLPKDLADIADDVGPAASVTALASRVRRQLTDVGYKDIRESLFAIWNCKRMQSDSESGADTITNLSDTIDRDAPQKWLDRHLEGWRSASASLAACLDEMTEDHAIFISMKAQMLAYSHQHLLTGAQLVTDVRPVFDTAGKEILETVITHTLSIHYSDSTRDASTMAFAVDAEDIEHLRKACERALTKGEVLKEKFAEFHPVILPEKVT